MKNFIQNKCKDLIAVFAFILLSGSTFANCAANYTYSVNGQAVTFTNTSTGTSNNTYYFWNFGDNNFAYTANAAHTYQYGGTYIVCMTISDSTNNNSCYSTLCDTLIIVGPQAPCHASFYSSSTNNAGTFISTSTGTTPYTQYSWSFGDNTSGTGQNTTHLYTNPGYYNVCLFITDNSTQCSDSFCTQVYIYGNNNTSCTASFTHTTNGSTVTFTNTSTGITNQTGFNWTFGDNANMPSYTQNTVYTYQYGGTYNVCLSIWDSLNTCYSSFCDTVTVSGPPQPCHAAFTTWPDTTQPHNIWAYNTSTGTNPMTYTWSWGDNTPDSYTAYPSHTYASSGMYVVCLTIVDANNCTSTHCDSVNALRMSSQWASVPSTINVINPNSTGVNELHNSDQISLYPNPATDQFYVTGKNLENMKYIIYDVIGNEVSNGLLHDSKVTVNELVQGVYIFRIADAKGNSFTKQFIKN